MVHSHSTLGPLFVIGVHRSGTTWVANALCNHSQIYGVQAEQHFGIVESWYFSHLDGRFGNLDEPVNKATFLDTFARTAFFQCSSISVEDLETLPNRSYSAFFDAFMNLAASQSRPQARFWLEKTPLHTLYLDKLLAYYPDAKFIAVERLLTATANSSVRLFQLHKKRRPSPSSLSRMVLHWYKYRAYLHHFMKLHPERFFSMQYEAVATNSELHFRSCLQFLDLEWEPAVLEERFKRNTSFQDQQPAIHSGLTRIEQFVIWLTGILANRIPYRSFRWQESRGKPRIQSTIPFLSQPNEVLVENRGIGK